MDLGDRSLVKAGHLVKLASRWARWSTGWRSKLSPGAGTRSPRGSTCSPADSRGWRCRGASGWPHARSPPWPGGTGDPGSTYKRRSSCFESLKAAQWQKGADTRVRASRSSSCDAFQFQMLQTTQYSPWMNKCSVTPFKLFVLTLLFERAAFKIELCCYLSCSAKRSGSWLSDRRSSVPIRSLLHSSYKLRQNHQPHSKYFKASCSIFGFLQILVIELVNMQAADL